MKSLSRTVLILYILSLLWVVLFKLSFDLSGVLEYGSRSLNLIPFADYSRSNVREMIDNLIAFIPFGLLLSVNLKQMSFWRKLWLIGIFSFTVELLQFALAIGTTDIIDVIMNTLGGLFGLTVYKICSGYVDTKKLDGSITTVALILLVVLILYRVLFLKVKY